MKGSRLWVYLTLGAIALCAFVVAAGFLYAAYASPGSRAAAPYVEITGTQPQGAAPAGQPVVVFAQAHDPAGITRAELWVNGAKTASQDNPNPSPQFPFEISSAWIPTGAGEYLMVMKAVNPGGQIGESEPVVMHVGARAFEPDASLQGEYIVQPDDTWESIAESLDIPLADLRAANPGVESPVPGSGLHIPPRPEGDAGGEAGGGPAEEVSDAPSVDPPAPAAPPAGESHDAEPRTDDELFGFPLPGGLLCVLNPEACRIPIDGVPPPARPDGVTTGDPASGCGVNVFWNDNSDNETGYRVYRFASRPRFRMDLLELFGPTAGAGTALRYLDGDPPRGEFFYAVVAYNAGGDTWSPPSPTHTSEGCGEEGETAALVIEGLSIDVPTGFDRLYCYVSLADSPFERVPFGASSFITLEAGTWDIAEHFSGSNKRTVLVNRLGPLNLVVECLGWQGGELINLGRFRREHGPAEWDGRTLTAASDSGGFTVTYRINYSFRAADEGGRAAWPLVDPSLPAPYDVRLSDFWEDCRRTSGDGWSGTTCNRVDEPALAWSYDVELPGGRVRSPSEGGGLPVDFIVYSRRVGESVPHIAGTVVSSWSAPRPRRDCSESVAYSVSAVVGEDPLTHEQIQSPLSEELVLPINCAALEITLDPLWVRNVDDGDFCTIFTDCRDDYEAYGWVAINGRMFTWNAHCDPGFGEGCLRGAPSYTAVLEASEHDWANLWLNTGDGYRRGNNVIRIPIFEGEPLHLSFTLMDHDDRSGDDVWCRPPGGRTLQVLAGRPLSEWLAIDQQVVQDSADTGSGSCILRFHVRGVPGS